jgi:hypothetical protein
MPKAYQGLVQIRRAMSQGAKIPALDPESDQEANTKFCNLFLGKHLRYFFLLVTRPKSDQEAKR